MSCDDFVYSPRGRQGIGVIQPQSGLDYPFVSPSDDVRFLFADFFFSYDDPADYGLSAAPYALPLRVSWVAGIGCDEFDSEASLATTHTADVIVVDANDQVVFDSTEAQEFTERDWGTDYKIYEWQARETDNTPVGAVCRAVVYKTWPESFEIPPQNYPQYFAPERAVLDARATYRMPKRVLSLSVRAGNQTLGTLAELRSVALLEGYNMQIRAGAIASANQLRNTEIAFAAIPGAGAGQYSDCDETPTPPIRNINGVRPNEYGDFVIASADCGYVRVPTMRVDENVTPVLVSGAPTLSIGDDCPPCCDCPDYVNLALYMNRLHGKYKLIGDQANATNVLYKENSERWMAQYDCRMSEPLRIFLVPQYCPRLDVVLFFCNHCDDCLKNVKLSVNFSTVPNGSNAEVVCGHTEIRAPRLPPGSSISIDGSYPSFSVNLPPIDKGESGYVKFRLKFDERLPISVTGTLTGTYGFAATSIPAECGGTTPATATATATLNCDKFGNNSQPC